MVGANEDMTRYRARAVLLFFLLLNLTACQTWQSVSLDAISPAQLIEEDQPDRVRVSGVDVLDLELERPAVDGDQLVAPGGFSMPLADILRLEVRGLHILRSLGAGYLGGLAVVGLVMVIDIVRCGDQWAC
jgi:hypothetical protein